MIDEECDNMWPVCFPIVFGTQTTLGQSRKKNWRAAHSGHRWKQQNLFADVSVFQNGRTKAPFLDNGLGGKGGRLEAAAARKRIGVKSQSKQIFHQKLAQQLKWKRTNTTVSYLRFLRNFDPPYVSQSAPIESVWAWNDAMD